MALKNTPGELISNVYRHYLSMMYSHLQDNPAALRFHLGRMGARMWYSDLDDKYGNYFSAPDRNEQIMSELYASRDMRCSPKKWWKFWS